MAPTRSRNHRAGPARCRSDGWTPARQIAFLDAFARTRSVTRAAAFAGMSRASAHRLRARPSAALFAAAWDRALKGHKLVNIAAIRRHADAEIRGENPPKIDLSEVPQQGAAR